MGFVKNTLVREKIMRKHPARHIMREPFDSYSLCGKHTVDIGELGNRSMPQTKNDLKLMLKDGEIKYKDITINMFCGRCVTICRNKLKRK